MQLNDTQNIVDVTLENFQQVFLQLSTEKVILVDFWADWCQPCKDLMPVLEKIARQYPNELVLAKVDCDRQPEVAAQFGIRSLPTVMVVKDGQPVDGFAGVQPESAIREMLAKYLPQPGDAELAQAAALVAQGDYENALPLAKQAYDAAPDNIDARYTYADCLIENGALELAKSILQSIKMADQDSRFAAISSKIELAEQAAESPELKALQAAVAEQPDNLQLKLDLAVQLQQAHKQEEALALAYSVVQQDLNFGDARKIMLDLINALAEGDPLKPVYRRKLYSLLY